MRFCQTAAVVLSVAALSGCLYRDAARKQTNPEKPIDPNALLVREYRIPISAETNLTKVAKEVGIEVHGRPEWKPILTELGVTWPEGAGIRYDFFRQRLVVTNVIANLRLVEMTAATMDPTPRYVATELEFVEFRLKDIERILRRKPAVDCETLAELRRQGRGRLLHAPRLVVESGSEGVVKSVIECSYPTNFAVILGTTTNGTGGGAPVAQPEGSDFREAGLVFEMAPDVSPDAQIIDVCMTPQVVDGPKWQSFGPSLTSSKGSVKKLNVAQPLFHADTLSSWLSLRNGATVLAGGGVPAAGNKTILYWFLTAYLTDAKGDRLRYPLTEVRPFDPDEHAGEMATWMYRIRPKSIRALLSFGGFGKEQDKRAAKLDYMSPAIRNKLRDSLSSLGAEWPKGSWVRYLPAVSKLIVRNTAENMSTIEKIFTPLCCFLSGLDVEARHVEFRRSSIEELVRRKGRVHSDDLLELWRSGQGRLICSPKFLTKNGSEAVIKGVGEPLYPTEFRMRPGLPLKPVKPLSLSDFVVEPGSFEWHQVGTIFEAMGDVSPDGNVVQFDTGVIWMTQSVGWHDFSSTHMDSGGNVFSTGVKQPVFHVHEGPMTASFYPGSCVLVSGGTPQPDPEYLVYTFVTPRIMDPDGKERNVKTLKDAGKGVSCPKGMERREIDCSWGFPEIVRRMLPEFGEKDIFGLETAVAHRDITGEDMKRVLAQRGVAWPDGSHMDYSMSSGSIVAVNTPKNLRMLRKALGLLGAIPSQVAVEVNLLEIASSDVAERLQKGQHITLSVIRKLQQRGKAKLVCAPRVLLDSGDEKIKVRGTREHLYPTEYQLIYAESGSSSAPGPDRGVVEPQAFEMRETGVILKVSARARPNGERIDLDLTCQWTPKVTWTDHGTNYIDRTGVRNTMSMKQPVFHSHVFSTKTSVENGKTMLVSGGMKSEDGKKMVYALVTAELVDYRGRPIVEAE